MQCVAARGKADPHRRKAEDELRMQAKSEFPVISMDYCFTRGLTEPTEADKEDLRLYGGDLRGGVALVVTDDWSRGVLALPVSGKGRQHAKYLAEQIVRYISACGFSTCILKADAEPSTRLLLDIVSKARQKLGFKTVVELAGPEDSQGNGRVEREIQTVRDSRICSNAGALSSRGSPSRSQHLWSLSAMGISTCSLASHPFPKTSWIANCLRVEYRQALHRKAGKLR
jgi:hypothetical protein